MKNFRRPSSKERKIIDKFKKMRIKAILNDPDKNWIQKIIEVPFGYTPSHHLFWKMEILPCWQANAPLEKKMVQQ